MVKDIDAHTWMGTRYRKMEFRSYLLHDLAPPLEYLVFFLLGSKHTCDHYTMSTSYHYI